MSDQGRSGRDSRCQDLAVEPDLAGVVGRVQCSLIGAGRLAVAFSGDTPSALLLTLASRALGHDHVSVLLDRPQRPAAADRAQAEALADELQCGILDTWLPRVERRRALADLPIDAVAYVEGLDAGVVGRAPVRPVGAYRVLYPFAEAGLSSRDIARVGYALGLSSVDDSTLHLSVGGV